MCSSDLGAGPGLGCRNGLGRKGLECRIGEVWCGESHRHGKGCRSGRDGLGEAGRIGRAAPGAARLTCPARLVALKRFEAVGHYASFSISSTSNLLFPLVRLAPNPISAPTSSRVVNVV